MLNCPGVNLNVLSPFAVSISSVNVSGDSLRTRRIQNAFGSIGSGPVAAFSSIGEIIKIDQQEPCLLQPLQHHSRHALDQLVSEVVVRLRCIAEELGIESHEFRYLVRMGTKMPLKWREQP